MAAHDLEHDHAVVRFGRGVQTVQGVGAGLDGRIEPEREVGGVQIVVDGLGDPDHVHALGGELCGDAQGVFAADRDQGLDPLRDQVVPDPLDPPFLFEGVRPGRPEDRPASMEDPGGVVRSEVKDVIREGAAPAVFEADDGVPVLVDALSDHGPDDRVEAGTVSSPGKDADPRQDPSPAQPPKAPFCPGGKRSIRP